MLKISLISVGNKLPAWVNEGALSYLQRIRGNTEVKLIEVPALKRGKQADILKILAQEASAINKQLSHGMKLICLDRLGKPHDSLAVANKIEQWQQIGENVAFVIGGPEGLDAAFLKQADETWTLSKMTFSHHVARLMLAEQLYRGWSITQGLPYHR